MRNDIFAGITFNGKHSYRDYGLFLAAPPDFGAPEPKLQTVDIPGRDGVLDFTEAAVGEVTYENREMTFTFSVEIRRERREMLRTELMNDLHGYVIEEIVYDFDPHWYYTGRCFVSFEDVLDWKMKVVITVDAEPYKMARENTVIAVSPADFKAETISLGEGRTNQKPNSIFTFGTMDNPQLDLTMFTTLTFIWQDYAPIGTPYLQITDGDGVIYGDYSWINAYVDGRPATEVAVGDITDIDKERVYRILCSGRAMGILMGQTVATATVPARVERKTVFPVFTATADVTALINGRKFAIYEGTHQSPDLQLTHGENQITFVSDSATETVTIEYQDGSL